MFGKSCVNHTGLLIETSIFQGACEKLGSSDSEYEEEEHEHKQRVSQKGNGIDQGRHDNPETLNTGNGPEGSDNSE